jgi:hypothetical protein
MKRSLSLLTLPLVTLLGACPADNAGDEVLAAGEASDSAEVVSDESQTISLVTDGTDMAAPSGLRAAPTAAQVATYASQHFGDLLLPATCHSATVNNATVTFTFNDCTGPRGLVHLTGTLVVDYSIDTQGIHAHAVANGFSVNQSTIDIDATATYTNVNGVKTLSVVTAGSGTGPLGNTFTRSGTYTMTWNATTQCFTLDGSWTTSALGLTRSTTVTGLSKCMGKCPANGGSIAHTFTNNVTLTVTFDGSAVAHWATTNGKSGTINLVCVAN